MGKERSTYEQLVASLGGDARQREALLERLRPRLVLWASSRMSDRLRSRMTSEDVAQEILLALHQSLEQFRGDDKRAFRSWLFAVAENRIRDLGREAGALKRRTPEPADRPGTTPSGRAIRNEMAFHLQVALARLPEDYRRVIRLRRFEERAVAEVANAMQRSPNAVRVVYCRAIRALRAELGVLA